MPVLPESVFFSFLSTYSYLSEWDKPLKELESFLTCLLIDAKIDSQISAIFSDYRFRYGRLAGISRKEQ